MHTRSDLLGCHIGQLAEIEVVHSTMVTQATQPPSQNLQMITPYIGGQSSMGGQPSTGDQPLVAEKKFTRGKPSAMGKIPIWLQHKQA